MSDNQTLWINTGGTLVSERYNKPNQPPKYVSPLPPDEAGCLMHEFLIEIGKDHNVVGYSYGSNFSDATSANHVLGKYQKDSKDFTEEDIRNIAEIIENDYHTRVLITHGTDKLTTFAQKLKKELAQRGVLEQKTVVITGAMVPLAMRKKEQGDAKDNIITALRKIDYQSPGLYIAAREVGKELVDLYDPEGYEKAMALSKKNLQFTIQRGR